MKNRVAAGAGILAIFVTLAGCEVSVDTQNTTPATETQQVYTREALPAQTGTTQQSANIDVSAQNGREQFGSLQSPDGQWLLQEKHNESQGNNGDGQVVTVVEHTLYLYGLKGQGDKTVLGVKEQHDQMVQPVPGKRFASNWTPAGWSADGAKVYYATQPYTEGLGGWYPNSSINFERIMEVDVAAGTEKEIFNPKSGFILSGVADFDGGMQKALSTDKENQSTLTLTDLKTGESKAIFNTVDGKNGDGISSAIFSPSGTKVAVATYTTPSAEEQSANDGPLSRTYRLFIVDLATLEAKEVKAPSEEWDFANWVNESSVKVKVYANGDDTPEQVINL